MSCYIPTSPLVKADTPIGESPVAQLDDYRGTRAQRNARRLQRARERNAARPPWRYEPNDITHKKAHHRIVLGGGMNRG